MWLLSNTVPYADRELLPASAALLQAKASIPFGFLPLGLQSGSPSVIDFVVVAAVGANRTIRPDDAFQLRKSRFLAS